METWIPNNFQIAFDQLLGIGQGRRRWFSDDWLLISRHRRTSHKIGSGAPFSSLKLVCRMTLYHDFALNIGILYYILHYTILCINIFLSIYILYYIIKLTNISHKSPSCSFWPQTKGQSFFSDLVSARFGHEYFQRSQGSETGVRLPQCEKKYHWWWGPVLISTINK